MTFVSQVRLAAWGLALAILIVSFVPPGVRPETGTPHFLEYVVSVLFLERPSLSDTEKNKGCSQCSS
jgi:hypothetical protein